MLLILLGFVITTTAYHLGRYNIHLLVKSFMAHLLREDVTADVLENWEDDFVSLDLVDQPDCDVGLLGRPQLVVPVRQELLKTITLGSKT